MRIVSVTGGKGGTGKSTVAVNLAVLAARVRSVTLADLDVEAPNDHILLGVKLEGEEPVKTMLPFIDYGRCTGCGACSRVCDTGAIIVAKGGVPYVIPRLCSGCRACLYACPEGAIREGARVVGYTYHTRVEIDGVRLDLVTGVLREGEEHTPPVVIAAKRRALSIAKDLLIIDTAAGTANHVALAIDGSRLAVAVTEPTPLGVHDLRSILELTSRMGLETWIVVNKWGVRGSEKMLERIEALASEYKAVVKARIPYSRAIVESYVSGKPLVLYKPGDEASRVIAGLASELLEVL